MNIFNKLSIKMQRYFSTLVQFLFDVTILTLSTPAAIWFRVVRKIELINIPLTNRVLNRIGIYPLLKHYYDPYVDETTVSRKHFEQKRELPGIDLRTSEQLDLLNELKYSHELVSVPEYPIKNAPVHQFHVRNWMYEIGDADIYYSLIRKNKPSVIIEIGAGNSTKLALMAIKKNQVEDSTYRCRLICIEPFENKWLDDLGVEVVRVPVEKVSNDYFNLLNKNDILFVDSSHTVRSGGDVESLFLRIIPKLNKGVWIQVHDVFTPYEYLADWVLDRKFIWGEQYVMEAFLSFNKSYQVELALHYLFKEFPEQFNRSCYLTKFKGFICPRAVWFQKID